MSRAARAAPPRIGAAVMTGAMPVEVADPAALLAAPAAELAAEPAAPVALVRALEAEPAAEEAPADALSAAPEASAAAEERAAEALAAASEAEPDREPTAPPAAPTMEKRVVEPTVEVATALPSEVMVVRISEVVIGTLEPAMPEAPVEMAAPAPPVVTPTAGRTCQYGNFDKGCHSKHTRAEGGAVCRNLRIESVTASLVCAVAQTVAETWVSAEAGGVGRRAAEGAGQTEHVVDAETTAFWDAVNKPVSSMAVTLSHSRRIDHSLGWDLSGHEGGAGNEGN